MVVDKIIVQAGGKGTRLGKYTMNKPKALLSVDSKPMLFHLFDLFPDKEFHIIGDTKYEVLEKYLRKYAKVKYKLYKAAHKGTASGIRDIVEGFDNDDSFMITWSDLILSQDFAIPNDDANYIGIAKDFRCRWSYRDGKMLHEPSYDSGIAGLFVFKNKEPLLNLPDDGALVGWLSTQNVKYQELDLIGTKEFGLANEYEEYEIMRPKYRPFNLIKFLDDKVEKKAVNDFGVRIAELERAWYENVADSNFDFLPKIYSYDPLLMEKIDGYQLFDKKLDVSRKEIILNKLVEAIKSIHKSHDAKAVIETDIYKAYFAKTFDRLEEVRDIIPFANDDFIYINGIKCLNVFQDKGFLSEKVRDYVPDEFRLIHGDITFSNIIVREINPYFIDPRGYFGESKLVGDVDYDWAKLYYSLVGNYDRFNRKDFDLDILEDEVNLKIGSSSWEDMETEFFNLIGKDKKDKINFLHAMIWLSLTTYAWDDYDMICGAFYNGLLKYNEWKNEFC